MDKNVSFSLGGEEQEQKNPTVSEKPESRVPFLTFTLSWGSMVPLHWVTPSNTAAGDCRRSQAPRTRSSSFPDAAFRAGKMKNQILPRLCITVLSEHRINFHKRAWWQRG